MWRIQQDLSKTKLEIKKKDQELFEEKQNRQKEKFEKEKDIIKLKKE